MKNQKKRIVTSLEKINPEVRDMIMVQYPEGWKDRVRRINHPNGTFFHAIMVETDEISYLVKVRVKVDSMADLEKAEEKLDGYKGEEEDADEQTDSEVEDEPDFSN